jgi:sporulation protein YlmC with PRC-barrel domain
MLKKHMAACLVATAFMAAPALAQTSSQFMTHMNPDQWRGSKLVGVNIYGQNNEKIGDVNEVLIDRKGNADAIVVGVGGFLGMGEKDVALPFSAVEWKYDRNDLSTASTNRPATTGTTAANPPASGSMAANPPATGAPATTGTTAANRPATADRSNMDRGYPDHGVVHFTKDELKNAPTFRYSMNDDTSRANAPARTTAPANTNPPASTTAPATAPKQ